MFPNKGRITQQTYEDGDTVTYTYDNAGNILSRKEYSYTTQSLEGITPIDTIAYTYGNEEWGDLLTAYDGTAISYDAIGNPLSDGAWTYTWEHGRELAAMTSKDGSGLTWTYTYNADGLRTKRTNGTTTYNYVYYGGQLQYMSVGSEELYFTTAPDGTAMGVIYQDYPYYYMTNLQGDVVGLVNHHGAQVVAYTYDAWGNILSTTGTMASTLGAINPIRYRGYVYDSETGLYYLQSRYYNSEMGRFINADAYTSTGQGFVGNNMFAYCGNNPINRVDPEGHCWWLISLVGLFIEAGKFVLETISKVQKKMPTDVSDKGVQFIADYEGGFRSEPYDDGYGYMTIGYGHLIKEGESFDVITKDESLALLKKDLSYWEREVTRYSQSIGVIWDQNQYDAFVSLAYNSGYNFKGVMDKIVAGIDPYDAFGSIIYAGGKSSLGLYRRRMDEADMFVSGTYARTYRGWQE